MTKEQFVGIMNELESEMNRMSEFSIAIRKVDHDSNGLFFSSLIELPLNILKYHFDDKNDWIGYYIFERNWGKKTRLGKVTINKKQYKIETVEDLYKILTLK